MLDFLMPLFGTLIRHGLTAIGGIALATDSTVNQVTGALMTLFGVGLSVWKAKRDAAAAAQAAAPK